jgi:hypothetical protein
VHATVELGALWVSDEATHRTGRVIGVTGGRIEGSRVNGGRVTS